MNKAKRRRESHSGYHFLNTYQNCQRKFSFFYLYRLEKKKKAFQLHFGSAFHEGKSIYYTTRSKRKALRKAKEEVENSKKYFFSEEEYEMCRQRVVVLLDKWIDEYGKTDLENYELVETEKEHKIFLKHAP